MYKRLLKNVVNKCVYKRFYFNWNVYYIYDLDIAVKRICIFGCNQVTVGNLMFKLGQLKYQKLDWMQLESDDQWVVVMVAAACGGTLVTLIVIIIAVYKRKSSRAERQFTKLQVQLDALESNIRHECKQGTVVLHNSCCTLEYAGSGATLAIQMSGLPPPQLRSKASARSTQI